jgi:hypothetical protein
MDDIVGMALDARLMRAEVHGRVGSKCGHSCEKQEAFHCGLKALPFGFDASLPM